MSNAKLFLVALQHLQDAHQKVETLAFKSLLNGIRQDIEAAAVVLREIMTEANR